MTAYAPNINVESMPARIRAFPISDRFKMPVPWFVSWIDGKPEFRAADGEKLRQAVRFKCCWVCGEQLGRNMTFVVGPMCGINRTSAEPPSHYECAKWSAQNCPFLVNRDRKRREDEEINSDALVKNAPGFAITRNPGVCLLWTTRTYGMFSDGRGGVLFKLGEPESIECFAAGRIATLAELDASIESGLPILRDAAASDGPDGTAALNLAIERFSEVSARMIGGGA